MSPQICLECGARLAEGAERCDLCGIPVDRHASRIGTPENPGTVPHGGQDLGGPDDEDVSEPKTADGEKSGAYCNECGWRNPLGAKFCSRCGSQLQEVGAGGSATHVKPASLRGSQTRGMATQINGGGANAEDRSEQHESGLSRYVGALIGLAVLIVVALYMITVISKQNVGSSGEAVGAVEAPAEVRSAAVIEAYEAIPVSDRYAPTVDSLRTAIERAEEGTAQHELQRELVDFLVSIGRIDRAAISQQRLAGRTDSLSDWRRAGDLLYDWMETVSEDRRTDVALLAIDAYKRVLDEAPDDLDARAHLGWVYQYDPQNPMEAIRQTNMVLESDSDHLAANYNRGVFLLRINRLSDALEQFEKVKALSGEDSPYSRQADAWIESVKRQRESQRGG